MKRIMRTMLGGCLVLMASASFADEQDKGDPNQQITDEHFVFKASEDGLAEVNHGLQAAKMANSPDVKTFAQLMVKDHSKANKELLDLANKKGLKVARDMGQEHTAMQQKLSRLSGDEFDRHYMQHMVEGHVKAVALFKGEAKSGKDKGLQMFAEKTLPTLEEHLKMARQIHDKLKGGK